MLKIILESYWKMLLDAYMCTLILLLLKESCTEMASGHYPQCTCEKKHVPKICNNSKKKYKHYKEYYYYDTIMTCITESSRI